MSRPLIFCTFMICFLIWQCTSNEQEETSGLSPTQQQYMQGKKVYKKYCLACHGADGTMGMSGAKDLSESELDLVQRELIIANGKGMMTPFKNILTPEEITAVAKYTMTLSETDEK